MSVQKAAVSVSEMAGMVGLSRARFYELVEGGVLPHPVYFVATRRPVYTRELQGRCLEVRRSGQGSDGRPVVFYDRKKTSRASSAEPKRPVAPAHAEILAGVRGLGISAAAISQVDQAVKAVYPSGTDGIDQGEVIRKVFLYLVKQGRRDGMNRQEKGVAFG